MRQGIVVLTVLSLFVAGFGARADEPAADGLELVAEVAFQRATHLEFMQREVDGELRTYALAGSRHAGDDGGLHIVDITDPTAPVRAAHIPCDAIRNADPALSPDGTVVTLTADGGSGCRVSAPGGFKPRIEHVGFADVTDLSRPLLYGTPDFLPGTIDGVHTAVFHPTENVVYLSNQATPSRTATLWIADLRGPGTAAEVLAAGTMEIKGVPMPQIGSGPHDITFSPDGTRAYVSAITGSYVLDTTGDNLTDPQLVSLIMDPSATVHHEAILHPNGRHLFVTDERLAISGTGGIPQCPGGGVHVYDLANEVAPVKVGIFHADDVRNLLDVPPVPGDVQGVDKELAKCTSHEGTFDATGDRLSLGWYYAGSRVFDTSALNAADLPPGAPVGSLITETASIRPGLVSHWSAKFHPADPDYVIATDEFSGLDVFRFTPAP